MYMKEGLDIICKLVFVVIIDLLLMLEKVKVKVCSYFRYYFYRNNKFLVL